MHGSALGRCCGYTVASTVSILYVYTCICEVMMYDVMMCVAIFRIVSFSLQANCGVFEPFCQRGTPQLWLIIKIQEYCFENAVFLKIFHKIIVLLYKSK